MTGRAYLLVWVCALCAVLGFAVYVTHGGSDSCRIGENPEGARFIVIGSSLSREAFERARRDPTRTFPNSIRVWWEPEISPEQALRLIACAGSGEPEAIFVEANTFVYEPSDLFALEKIENASRFPVLTRAMATFTEMSRPVLFTPFVALQEPLPPDEGWSWERPKTVPLPPALVDNDTLTRLRQSGATAPVVLFEPPRTVAQTGEFESHLGISLSGRLKEMAQTTGLPVLRFWPTWDDGAFRDYGSHLNNAGSDRFISEFEAAWRAFDNAR